jgi:hypothetical protein
MDNGQIFTNGTIFTMDSQNPIVEAVGVKDGLIKCAGSLDQVCSVMPDNSVTVDLELQTMLPSFIDPHGHFPDTGFIELFRADLTSPPRGKCNCLDEIFSQLREKAVQTPKGEWVMGAGLDETALVEGRLPIRDELDEISTDHPIWVIHASGHCGVANSLALERQGIYDDTPNPSGGRYWRDENGRANGYMEGLSAMGDMANTHFLIGKKEFAESFEVTVQEYLSEGVTLAQNSWTAKPLLELFKDFAEMNDPGIDLVLLPISEDEPELSKNGLAAQWPASKHITLGPRKILTDGSFLMRTAFLSEAYYTGANERPSDYGLSYVERDTLFAEVKKLHDMGFQIHSHCNGDASGDMFLDAVETALADNPRKDHRHPLIHGQLMRKDQLTRCAELGVTISFFPAHIYYWGDKHYSEILGPERSQNISPARWAEEAGVRFTIHNDAAVTPTKPLHLIHTAVNRKTLSGRTLGEAQRISVETALRAHTIDAAWQVFQETERGSLEVGKIADFVFLNKNPIEFSDTIDEIKVNETYRSGKIVWKR